MVPNQANIKLKPAAATTLPGLIQISGIGKFVSGSPFHDQAGVDLDGDGTITNDRPAGLDTSVGRRDVDQSLEIINSFRASRGLAPIPASLLKLDPYVSLDARVTKVIPLSVNRRLDLFFEGYNTLNHVTKTGGTTSMTSAAIFLRTGALDARQLQWGARFRF